MEKYDLVVIGAGPSGYAAAMRALDFKKKVLLVERKRVGGAGVTNGALSSKTWWEISRETHLLHKHLKRFNLKAPDVNFKEIQEEVRSILLYALKKKGTRYIELFGRLLMGLIQTL